MPDRAVELIEVPLSDRKLVERFIRVPWYVNREHHPSPRWVPPLLMDRRDYLDPTKNPFFEHVKAAFWIARVDGRDVGRVAAVEDADYIKFHNEKTGYLGMFECADEPRVAQALVDRAAQWLAARGMTSMIGPLELSTNYLSGVLIDAFDRDPGVNMPYNPPYYDRLLGDCGMVKAKDLLHWGLDPAQPVPERVSRVAEKMAAPRREDPADELRRLGRRGAAHARGLQRRVGEELGLRAARREGVPAHRQGPEDGPAPGLRDPRRGRRQAGGVRADDPERQPGS
jgi:hypothetical protein